MSVTASDFAHFRNLRPHPLNPRKTFDPVALKELADSISQVGILEPLVVIPDPPRGPGHFVIVAGERRFRAGRMAGLDEYEIIIRTGVDAAAAVELMLIENCQRADLGPADIARAMGALIRAGRSQADIARATGLSPSTVSYHLRLDKADDRTLARVRSGQLTAGAVHEAVKDTQPSPHRPYSKRPKPNRPPRPRPHFTATHPLAAAAAALCLAAKHPAAWRWRKVACEPCWEQAIRQDSSNGGGRPLPETLTRPFQPTA